MREETGEETVSDTDIPPEAVRFACALGVR